jgi:hypothetical protein
MDPVTPERLQLALERLRSVWVATGAPIAEHLAAPRPPASTIAALRGVGLDAPDELVSWFSWHDGHDYPAGTNRTMTACGIGHFFLIGMDQCLHELDVWRDVYSDESGTDAAGWSSCWFPLIRNASGSAAIAVVSEQPECQIGYFHPELGFNPVTPSIAALVERWAERIEGGQWTWNRGPGGGWMPVPPDRVTDVL